MSNLIKIEKVVNRLTEFFINDYPTKKTSLLAHTDSEKFIEDLIESGHSQMKDVSCFLLAYSYIDYDSALWVSRSPSVKVFSSVFSEMPRLRKKCYELIKDLRGRILSCGEKLEIEDIISTIENSKLSKRELFCILEFEDHFKNMSATKSYPLGSLKQHLLS